MPLYIANREELELLIVTMHADGWSIHALSRRFEIGRNTVRRILRKNERNREVGLEAPTRTLLRRSRLDPYVSRMQTILKEFPDITGLRMFEELRDAGYDGGITILRDRLRLMRRHRDAFEYFGGVPKQCLYDGEKTVILRWEAGRPVFNPAFVAFITHYRCKPVGCRPGRPETKGKVEQPFQFIENNLLNGRKFQDLDDLKARARWWLKEKSDHHLHETTNRCVLELFLEQEAGALQPLPLHPYDCSEVALRVCTVDGFIEFDTNFYSVPYECVGDILTFKAAEHEIFIYSQNLDLVAHHERLPLGAAKKLESPEHRLHPKVRYGLEPVKESFMALGNGAQVFLLGLKGKHPRNCGFHARFILQLKEKYTCSDINSALAHAARYLAFDGRSVERILAANATPRTLESIRNDKARDALQKALPQIEQRPLEEYSSLLAGGPDGRHDKKDQELSQDAQAFQDGKSP